MPAIKTKLKENYHRLKQILRKLSQGPAKQPQYALQPLRVKRFEGAVPRH